MDQFDFHKELYHIENDRRYTISESLSIPIAIVTGLLSFLFYLVTSFDYTQDGCMECGFLLFAVIGGIPLCVAVYSLIRAFSNLTTGFEYKGLPYPKDLLDHRQKLVAYYTQYGKGEPEANEKYQQYLIEKFAEHADHNTLVNDQKTRHVFNAKRSMVYALVGIGLACIPFGYNFFHKADPIDRVEVIKLPESITSTAEGNAQPTEQQQQPQNPQINGRQGEGPGTTTTPATATAGQAHQGRSRTDTTAH